MHGCGCEASSGSRRGSLGFLQTAKPTALPWGLDVERPAPDFVDPIFVTETVEHVPAMRGADEKACEKACEFVPISAIEALGIERSIAHFWMPHYASVTSATHPPESSQSDALTLPSHRGYRLSLRVCNYTFYLHARRGSLRLRLAFRVMPRAQGPRLILEGDRQEGTRTTKGHDPRVTTIRNEDGGDDLHHQTGFFLAWPHDLYTTRALTLSFALGLHDHNRNLNHNHNHDNIKQTSVVRQARPSAGSVVSHIPRTLIRP